MSALFKLFRSKKTKEPVEEIFDVIKVATAVLLIEMARADFHQDDFEDKKITELLKVHFNLSHGNAQSLFEEGQKKADDAVSLHEFTRTLHTKLTQTEKEKVIGMLWELAMVDQELDKYEDYLVRKIADLLYVSNTVVLRIRHQVTSK
tara:strand:- start:398 stop:841 length:444 start_codon:yes stop_codon:yes gene_type:complete